MNSTEAKFESNQVKCNCIECNCITIRRTWEERKKNQRRNHWFKWELTGSFVCYRDTTPPSDKTGPFMLTLMLTLMMMMTAVHGIKTRARSRYANVCYALNSARPINLVDAIRRNGVTCCSTACQLTRATVWFAYGRRATRPLESITRGDGHNNNNSSSNSNSTRCMIRSTLASLYPFASSVHSSQPISRSDASREEETETNRAQLIMQEISWKNIFKIGRRIHLFSFLLNK